MKNEPIFRNFFISVSDVLEAKLKAHERSTLNSQDKGELCEIFIRDFMEDAMGDLFKIFRGGKIINSKGESSNQLDVILCRKRILKLFADKGLYPLESVMAAIEVTANLTEAKFNADVKKLLNIPKRNYKFNLSAHYPEKYREQTHTLYRVCIPFTGIFGYKGDITPHWAETLTELHARSNAVEKSLLPSIIAVNKKGLIKKVLKKMPNEQIDVKYQYMDASHPELQGEPFARIVNALFNLSHEEFNMTFDYADYFNADIGAFLQPE